MVDLAVANVLFLADAVWDLRGVLTELIEGGVRVRMAVPTPGRDQSATVEDVFPSLSNTPGLKLVVHPELRTDVFRADDDLLVTSLVDGLAPALSPVLHLRRIGPAPLTAGYLTALDHVFDRATPWPGGR
ncbi:hypothetical protein ACIQ6Y_25295 [Streptomyces sp. NPDC096205]|uniref:hypothetical protein n=1 Tax=Streptomyces sp. NPDC096205 TaxID=3366081 RepID=UPI003806D6C3